MARTAQIKRITKETEIEVSLNLDGTGRHPISTGIGFFDHMLQAFAMHGGFDIDIKGEGDLQVDGHHTVEDTGIVLGQAFARALGDKSGIARFGNFTIPMDEALATCAVDISGRPYLVCDADFNGAPAGNFDYALVSEFFRAFAYNAGITLHVQILHGKNCHHMAEAMFKAVAHALNQACEIKGTGVLSTKGMLD